MKIESDANYLRPFAQRRPRLTREPVAQRVPEQRAREHGRHKRQTRRDRHPRSGDDQVAPARDHVSPTRLRRLNAESEKRQSTLEQNRIADAERRRDDRRPERVRKRVAPQHALRRGAERGRRVDERSCLHPEQLGANDPRDAHPSRCDEHSDHRRKARTPERCANEQENEAGKREQGVGERHEERVGLPSQPRRDRTDARSQRARQQRSNDADGERDTPGQHHPHK